MSTRASTLQDYKQRILRVLVHIQGHLDEELSLEYLAGLACFSPCHFHRVFHGMVGESVMDYIRRLRLERSAIRLVRDAVPILDLALEAGYGSHEAFTRSFRAAFGVSPSQYRRTRRLRSSVAVPSGMHFTNGEPPASFRVKRGNASMKVQLKQLPNLRVAFVRHVGPYSDVGRAWDQLLPRLGKDGWLGPATMFIGICHDAPEVTPLAKIRYDACVTLDAIFQPIDDIGIQVISGGTYAMTTHFGPYDRLGKTYSRLLGQWLPRSGHELRPEPCFETYLNDPQSTAPDDLVTDIYAPLR